MAAKKSAEKGRRGSKRVPEPGTGAPGVLYAASEVYPLIKTGGLADVAGYLPIALGRLGFDIRVVLPAYRHIVSRHPDATEVARALLPEIGLDYRLLQSRLPGSSIPYYLVDIPALFDRPGGPYQDSAGADWPDNPARFAAFCRVVCAMAMGRAGLDWRPDLIHCNDWHTGLVPALLSLEQGRPPNVFTIHNLAYQGDYSYETFRALALPGRFWSPEALEFYDRMSFIKGGLVFADQLITVSPQYAREITTPEYGQGMEGLLQQRGDRLAGILNGVDYNCWDPRNDELIERRYWIDTLDRKQDNKRLLQQRLGLPVNGDAVLLAHVSRLTGQKGIDLILFGLTDLLRNGTVQLVVLGTGEARYEKELLTAAASNATRLAVDLEYNEDLAHQIQAGADILLMPSRFEPCGLTQLYALRYGTIPVVCATGGLVDTVVDANVTSLAAGTATGFQFAESNTRAFVDAVQRAMLTRRTNAVRWRQLMVTAMQQDFSWNRSAARYASIYQGLGADNTRAGAGQVSGEDSLA